MTVFLQHLPHLIPIVFALVIAVLVWRVRRAEPDGEQALPDEVLWPGDLTPLEAPAGAPGHPVPARAPRGPRGRTGVVALGVVLACAAVLVLARRFGPPAGVALAALVVGACAAVAVGLGAPAWLPAGFAAGRRPARALARASATVVLVGVMGLAVVVGGGQEARAAVLFDTAAFWCDSHQGDDQPAPFTAALTGASRAVDR